MVPIRNIWFSFVFVLIIVGQLFAFPADNSSFPDEVSSDESVPVPELQNPVSSYLFAIEVNSSAQIITEVHRLSSMFVHPNQLIPLNFDFRSFAGFTIPTIYSSPVPIFIRGHALLN
jgi:hypothetical protein